MKWPWQNWTNSVRGDVVGPVVQAGVVHGDVYVGTHDVPHEADPVLILTASGSWGQPSNPHLDAGQYCWGAEITILVQTRSTQAVVLQDLRPAALEPLPLPGRGRSLPFDRQLSAVRVRDTYLDLDSPTPRVHIFNGPGFPFKVTAADPEVFRVFLVTNKFAAATLELEWTCANRSGTAIIDCAGLPVRERRSSIPWTAPPSGSR